MFLYVLFALCVVSMALGKPQDLINKNQKGLAKAENEDLKTANSYGFGYGLGFGYPYGYYGLYGHGLGYGYPYYGYYGAYGYPFYG
ncbi:hypothetical protein RUM44_013216 [Polyplax serrata]|uniref:Uncharacterized protein n=1 Tax=Polyplax serrata TaxID=468196 RepID=A0ABR1BH72_POLSC